MEDIFFTTNHHINQQINSILTYKHCFNNLNKKITLFSEGYDNQPPQQGLKNQIKQRFKQLGSNIDQLSKLFDWKICNLIQLIEKLKHQLSLKQKKSIQHYQGIIYKLQSEINKIIDKQNQLNRQIAQLKNKNSRLVEQFNQFSKVSNKKMNQLQILKTKAEFQVSNMSIKIKKSNQSDNMSYSQIPSLFERTYQGHYDQEKQKSRLKKNNKGKYDGQTLYQPIYMIPKKKEVFGCMPTSEERKVYKYDVQTQYQQGCLSPKKKQGFGCMPSSEEQRVYPMIGPLDKKLIKNSSYTIIPNRQHRYEYLISNLKQAQQSTSNSQHTQKQIQEKIHQKSGLLKANKKNLL